jgi:fatty acid desaturase
MASLDTVEQALDRNLHKRMRITSIRLVLWLVAIFASIYFWPEQLWIKWLLAIPLVTMLVVAALYASTKRRLQKARLLMEPGR